MTTPTEDADELRELIREAHGLMKDLNRLIKEAQTHQAALAGTIQSIIHADLEEIILDETTKRLHTFSEEARATIKIIGHQAVEYWEKQAKPYRETMQRLGEALHRAEEMGLIERMQDMHTIQAMDSIGKTPL